jgi:uncharacterized protein (DUF1778 family)
VLRRSADSSSSRHSSGPRAIPLSGSAAKRIYNYQCNTGDGIAGGRGRPWVLFEVAALALSRLWAVRSSFIRDTPSVSTRMKEEVKVLVEKRLAKHPGGRRHELKVRLTDEQRARVSRRASAAGVSISRLLVEAALSGSARTATERRAIVIELLSVRRLVAALGNNVNQLAKVANATGQIPEELPAVLEAVERALDRIETIASKLAPS